MIRIQSVPLPADAAGRNTKLEGGTALQTLRALAVDRRGSTGIMFALMIYPVMMLIGFGVDYSRTLAVRVRMQAVLDAAALAAARAAQTASNSEIVTKAQEAAQAYFDKQSIDQVVADSKKLVTPISTNPSKTEFTLNAYAWIQTPFMNAGAVLLSKSPQADAGEVIPSQCSQSWWSCQKVKATASSILKSGNGDESIEVSMMLDITGSMSGTKITDLKAAAKDAVDILIWSDQTKATSRVALVPFAEDVRLPTLSAFQKAVGTDNVSTASSGTGLKKTTYNGYNFNQPFGKYCVVERAGAEKYSDKAPSSSNGFAMTERIYSGWTQDCDVSSAAALQPLTSNKTTLTNKIDALTTAGGTAGHIGTAWAWYTLSPDWKDLWDADENKPKSYGTDKLKKIAILMTDGDYNTQYDVRGIKTGVSGNYTPANDSSKNQALALCTGMKGKGIIVYTVGFMVSDAAKTMLKSCATGESYFYDASDGESLRMAFRDIALKISTLRLSK